MRRDLSKLAIAELDNLIVQLVDAFEATGAANPSEEEKKYAVAAFKKSPGYGAIAKQLRRATKEDLEKATDSMRTTFLAGFRKPLLQAVKGLPHPSGGRRRAFSEQERADICRDIGALIVEGYSLKECVARVAKRCGVSSRTIYRVWQERAKKKRGSSRSA